MIGYKKTHQKIEKCSTTGKSLISAFFNLKKMHFMDLTRKKNLMKNDSADNSGVKKTFSNPNNNFYEYLFKSAVIFIFVYSFLFYSYYGLFQTRSGRKTDFDPYYTAAFCLKNKLNPYNETDLLKQSLVLNSQKNSTSINKCVYPPFYMQLLRVLTVVEVQKARFIWSCVVNPLFLIIIFYIIYLSLNKNIYFSLLTFSAALLLNPLYVSAALGQVNIIILGLFFLCYYFYKKDDKLLFSFFLSAAVLIKIIPAVLFLFLILNRKYKLFIYSAVAFFIIAGTSSFFNFEEYKIYFSEVLPQFSRGAGANVYNISLWSLFDRALINVSERNILALYSDKLFLIFQIIIFSGLIIKTLSFVKANDKNENKIINEENCMGLYILFSLLFVKTLWEHHLIIAFFPLFIFFKNYIFRIESGGGENFSKKKIPLILFFVSIAIIGLNLKYYDVRLNRFPLILFQFIKLYGLILLTLSYAFLLKPKKK